LLKVFVRIKFSNAIGERPPVRIICTFEFHKHCNHLFSFLVVPNLSFQFSSIMAIQEPFMLILLCLIIHYKAVAAMLQYGGIVSVKEERL
jgi:hypothetical protein